MTMAPINEAKLNELLGRAVVDVGAALQAPLMLVGDRLGLFRTLAEHGPLTSAALAERTGTAERYVREWVRAQAAGGYVTYDAATDCYSLSPEQAMLVADETSPAFLLDGFEVALAAAGIRDRLMEAFRSGAGIGWHEHHPGVFCGTERFYGPGYRANLVAHWIPALTGVEAKLRAGALVAEVGCGHVLSTRLMAEAYPNSTFIGFDYHEDSLEVARRRAREAGLEGRVSFQRASATDYPGRGYELVTMFDCLHDLGDPVGAAVQVRASLDPNGTWMIVEPRAGDRVQDNLHPLGRIFYAGSTLLCTPNALNQEARVALGAQAGETAIRVVVQEAGFTRFRRAAETPFNLVFEAQP